MGYKIVVFDLDETLGYFVELCILWYGIIDYLKIKHTDYEVNNNDFFELFKKYPEFIRPNIFSILEYLKNKKINGECFKLMIYTNNKRSKEWCNIIKNFYESKLNNYKLFDQMICAFKINNKQIELCRTSHQKKHTDFIKCTKLPFNTQICYIDDIYYPKMHTENVYYINVPEYIYKLEISELLKRFYTTSLGKQKWFDLDFPLFIHDRFSQSGWIYEKKSLTQYNTDKNASNNLMYKLQIFFMASKKTSSKKKYRTLIKTKRHMRSKLSHAYTKKNTKVISD